MLNVHSLESINTIQQKNLGQTSTIITVVIQNSLPVYAGFHQIYLYILIYCKSFPGYLNSFYSVGFFVLVLV